MFPSHDPAPVLLSKTKLELPGTFNTTFFQVLAVVLTSNLKLLTGDESKVLRFAVETFVTLVFIQKDKVIKLEGEV